MYLTYRLELKNNEILYSFFIILLIFKKKVEDFYERVNYNVFKFF